MLDGVYVGEVDTKLGKKKGTVVLATQGDLLAIELDAPIVGKQFVVGKAQGDTFTAQGTMKVKIIGEVDYTVEGKVSGDNIFATIRTSKKEIKISGVRL